MNFSIQTSGYNTEAMKGDYTIKVYGVGLYVHGLKRTRRIFPDGSEPFLPAFGTDQPSLRLYFPGMRHIFEYDEPRENWWVALKDPAPFAYDRALRQAVWLEGDYSFPIPSAIALEKAEIPALRLIFSQVQEKLLSGLPQHFAEAELLLAGVLARFLKQQNADSAVDASTDDVAEKLRKLIDSDAKWKYTLDELCAMAGVGRDCGRKCFYARYRIQPGDYRIKRRLALILNLLTSTGISIKEIAYRCGISHEAYLSALVRKHFQLSPQELRQKYRQMKI